MLEVIEDRYGLRSAIISSQLPVDHWHDLIGNPTVGDAILGRFVHNAHTISLKGESMKKLMSMPVQFVDGPKEEGSDAR